MTLKAGIVGCGGISRSHAQAYTYLNNMSLVSLCDINPTVLETRANEYGVKGRYTAYEEMLESEELDIVSICTHAPLHAPVTSGRQRIVRKAIFNRPPKRRRNACGLHG
jgi:predicted dehydrogenase